MARPLRSRVRARRCRGSLLAAAARRCAAPAKPCFLLQALAETRPRGAAVGFRALAPPPRARRHVFFPAAAPAAAGSHPLQSLPRSAKQRSSSIPAAAHAAHAVCSGRPPLRAALPHNTLSSSFRTHAAAQPARPQPPWCKLRESLRGWPRAMCPCGVWALRLPYADTTGRRSRRCFAFPILPAPPTRVRTRAPLPMPPLVLPGGERTVSAACRVRAAWPRHSRTRWASAPDARWRPAGLVGG